MSEDLKQWFGREGEVGTRLDIAGRSAVCNAISATFPNWRIYAESPCAIAGGIATAARNGHQRKIIVIGDCTPFAGQAAEVGAIASVACDADESNMKTLRDHIAYLRPRLAGETPSVGLGDRLGLATPGHIESGKDSDYILILAQQSIREMTRTARTAQQVMDEAVFGIFQCGYDVGFGSDADHLKNERDVDVTVAAGFTFFTIDPSEHVDDSVDHLEASDIRGRFDKMIVDEVSGAAGWLEKYVGRTFQVGSLNVTFNERALLKAAVKYGRAVVHAEALAKYIARTAPQHELELSVDETALPTSVAEHFFIARELRDRGVSLASLAPRFVGEFEKGIDYKGDLRAFEASLRDHVEIAKHLGPYKISVHSGSDKFSLYPIVAKVTKGLFHLKTAGTSYLEALRVVARHDITMFREIVAFCRERFETDKATYHISSTLDKVPPAEELEDKDLERVYLDENDGRQILHVTFGSVLTVADGEGAAAQPRFRHRLLHLLDQEEQSYVDVLKRHMGRHIKGLQGKA